MSAPPSSRFRPVPPQRGSFPVDHDGECAELAASYLKCLKLAGGQNAEGCRMLAKNYLTCRMDHQLMEKDDFKNLGFKEE